MVRLNKYLAEAGIASRRKADELIQQGRVSVNNNLIIEPGMQVDPAKDTVMVDGEKIHAEKKVYYLLNKPSGTITSTKDERNRVTVTSLIKTKQKIFPVGRLDYNTTGVLLLTNDGDFGNLMLHPSNKIIREYIAVIDRDLSETDVEKFLKGIFIEGKRSKFKTVEFPKTNNRKTIIVTTEEGRNHFVKNMFKTLGYTVKKLSRISFGPFNVQDIEPGSYLEIPEKDIQNIIKNYIKKR